MIAPPVTIPSRLAVAKATGSIFRLLRPHQWLKNVLIFLPLAAAHAFSLPAIGAAVISFVSFSLAASSGYIFNDILDLPHDRLHPTKKMRPLASGAVPLAHAVAMVAALFPAAFLLCLLLPSDFVIVLGGYILLTAAYSYFLKRKLMLDVVTLASLYGMRLVAGAAACGIGLSEWLVAFSFFMFLSLALMKRTTELVSLPLTQENESAGRGYRRSDLTAVMILSGASAFVSVLVFALYVNSEHVRTLYTRPQLLWGVAAVLTYWLGRTLLLAGRGSLDQDPVVFALTDRASLAAGLAAIAFVLAAV